MTFVGMLFFFWALGFRAQSFFSRFVRVFQCFSRFLKVFQGVSGFLTLKRV